MTTLSKGKIKLFIIYSITNCNYKYRMLATFIDTQRLVYDPIARPGISRDCKNPQRSDAAILQMAEPPAWWTGKPYEYKLYLLAQKNPVGLPDKVELTETPEGGRPRRKAAENPPNYLALDLDSDDDDIEEIPMPKRSKKDKHANLMSPLDNIMADDISVESVVPIVSSQHSIKVFFIL